VGRLVRCATQAEEMHLHRLNVPTFMLFTGTRVTVVSSVSVSMDSMSDEPSAKAAASAATGAATGIATGAAGTGMLLADLLNFNSILLSCTTGTAWSHTHTQHCLLTDFGASYPTHFRYSALAC
jgi:hypothetical protein